MLAEIDHGVNWLVNCLLTHTRVSWKEALKCLENQVEVTALKDMLFSLMNYHEGTFKRYFRKLSNRCKAIVCFLASLNEKIMEEKVGLREIGERGVVLMGTGCSIQRSNLPFHEMFRSRNPDGEVRAASICYAPLPHILLYVSNALLCSTAPDRSEMVCLRKSH